MNERQFAKILGYTDSGTIRMLEKGQYQPPTSVNMLLDQLKERTDQKGIV